MFSFKRERPLSIGIVGLGLIGGSMAKALKRYTDHYVYGCDVNSETIDAAIESGAIDEGIPPENLDECDLIFLALYPKQAVDFVSANIGVFQSGTILVDLCGVKRYPVERLMPLCEGHGLIYIGGHPMAGKEHWGFSGADAALFKGASMIITPDDHTPSEALELLTGLFADIGFANITTTTPEMHDSVIAFTSQLAHVVSSAYIKSPSAQLHAGFSAGSYKDLTRVAKLNPQMWTELFLENADDLVNEIDTIIVHLDEYRKAIADGDRDQLYKLLKDGKEIKEALDHEND